MLDYGCNHHIWGGILGYKFIKHEQSQTAKINDLKGQVALISAKLDADTEDAKTFTNAVSDDSFDYLAIGNSITKHGLADYWWGEWGMAASDADHDYYHRVVGMLKRNSMNTVNSAVVSGYTWEVQSHDRDEALETIDPYLTYGIDLVTVQLSENASDLSTFEADFSSLLRHIKDVCGNNCQVIVIDDFWSEEKHNLKKNVCEEFDILFVDLSDIRGVAEYQVGMGTAVSGEDGEEHIIEHSGVAGHPGDEGMRIIAERVLVYITP